jgi:hypothetical protein
MFLIQKEDKMANAYILKAVRTPGCKAKRGKFTNVRPDHLATVALKELLRRTKVEPEQIEDVILGCSFPEAEHPLKGPLSRENTPLWQENSLFFSCRGTDRCCAVQPSLPLFDYSRYFFWTGCSL